LPPAQPGQNSALFSEPCCPLQVAVDVVDGACSDAAATLTAATAVRNLAYIARQVLTALLHETLCVPRALWVAVRARKRCNRMQDACARGEKLGDEDKMSFFDCVSRRLKLAFAEVRHALHVEHALSRDVAVLSWVAAAHVLGAPRSSADFAVGAAAADSASSHVPEDKSSREASWVHSFASIVASGAASGGGDRARALPSAAPAWEGAARALSSLQQAGSGADTRARVPYVARYLGKLVDELRDLCRADEANGHYVEAMYALAYVTCIVNALGTVTRAACRLLDMPRAREPRKTLRARGEAAEGWVHVVIRSRNAALVARGASGGECDDTHLAVCAVPSVRRAATRALRWRRDVALQHEEIKRCIGSRARGSADDLCEWPRLNPGAPQTVALRKAHYCGITFTQLIVSRGIKLSPCLAVAQTSSLPVVLVGDVAVAPQGDATPRIAPPAPAHPSRAPPPKGLPERLPPVSRRSAQGRWDRRLENGTGAFCSLSNAAAGPRLGAGAATAALGAVDESTRARASLQISPLPQEIATTTRKRPRTSPDTLKSRPCVMVLRAPKALHRPALPKYGTRVAFGSEPAVETRSRAWLVTLPCLDSSYDTKIAEAISVARRLCGQVQIHLLEPSSVGDGDTASPHCDGRLCAAIPKMTPAQHTLWLDADLGRSAWQHKQQQREDACDESLRSSSDVSSSAAVDDVIDRAVQAVRRDRGSDVAVSPLRDRARGRRSPEQGRVGTAPIKSLFTQTAANVRALVWQDVADSSRPRQRDDTCGGNGRRDRASRFASELILTLVFRYVLGVRDNTLGDVFVLCCDGTDQLGAVGAPEVAMVDAPPDIATARENFRREKLMLREAMRSTTNKCSLTAVLGHALSDSPARSVGDVSDTAQTAASRALDEFAARHDVAVQTCMCAMDARDARFRMCKARKEHAAYVGGSSPAALYACLARCSLVLLWHEVVAPEAVREATRRHGEKRGTNSPPAAESCVV